jgi:hypothetical protein
MVAAISDLCSTVAKLAAQAVWHPADHRAFQVKQGGRNPPFSRVLSKWRVAPALHLKENN